MLPEWKDVPTITEESLKEFQANSVAYAEHNSGPYASSNVDAPLVVMLMAMVQELREIKKLLESYTGENIVAPSLKVVVEKEKKKFKKVAKKAKVAVGGDTDKEG